MDYCYVIFSVFTELLSKMVPKKKNRWVFGSWFGNSISDNPKAVSDYMQKYHPDIEIIWIVRKPEHYQNMTFKVIKRNSLKGIFYVMRSSVAIFNQGYMDLSTLNFLGGVFRVQLWHGIAWKKIGDDARKNDGSLKKKFYMKAFHKITNYDLYIAPCDKYASVLESAFKAEANKILKVGQPRNEILFSEQKCQQLKDRLIKSMNCSIPEPQIVVYMPTFRDQKQKEESIFNSGLCEEILSLAEKHNFIILEKSHYKDVTQGSKNIKCKDRMFFTPEVDAQILLASADLLITDYSSCFFDFLIRDKPIIHYIYDYDYYKNEDRGIYYEAKDVIAGSAVFTKEQLVLALEENLKQPLYQETLRERTRRNFITYETPNNSRIIVNRILEAISLKD